MDRPEQEVGDIIRYPQILHHVYISESLIPTNDRKYQELLRKKRRLNKYIGMLLVDNYYYRVIIMYNST